MKKILLGLVLAGVLVAGGAFFWFERSMAQPVGPVANDVGLHVDVAAAQVFEDVVKRHKTERA